MICLRVPFSHLLLTVIVFSCIVSIAIGEDELKCLQGVKNSLSDPQGKLRSWSFTNTSAGSLCSYTGVSCWNENRLISLELRDMKLAGDIPEALQYCHNLQSLDLSGNQLTSSIPAHICTWWPYLVTIDLSDNQLTGSISADLVNCSYLNNLILSNNKLSGTIPYQFSGMQRFKEVYRMIPSFLYSFNSTNFVGNDGLCGWPLGICGGGGFSKKDLASIIAAGVSGVVASMLLLAITFSTLYVRDSFLLDGPVSSYYK
ncbi:probable inactive receptor kinase At1g27190 [Cornus florida]|uniref:probable inactive receptor kinase At1g27190 n=1 Tax=Cornus florida TaxID=4283 RepID=UPI00289AC0BA|nr:probable inactive receptor kinase At1g27190 [Cornus florida]